MQIRIPTNNLQATFAEVKGRHVWGTDIYTDDSDIVCAVMHCGYYNASLKKPVAVVAEMRVVVQILPPQTESPVFVRNGIRSRAWWAGGTSCSYKVRLLWQPGSLQLWFALSHVGAMALSVLILFYLTEAAAAFVCMTCVESGQAYNKEHNHVSALKVAF